MVRLGLTPLKKRENGWTFYPFPLETGQCPHYTIQWLHQYDISPDI